MRIVVAALSIVALFSPATAAAGTAELVKCAQPSNAPVVYLLDGKVVHQATFRAVDRTTIQALNVACSDERHRVFGVDPGRDIVLILTKAAFSILRESLEAIVPLQEAYLEKYGMFANRLEYLHWNDPSGLIAVELCLSGDGNRWTATGTYRFLDSDQTRLSVSGWKTRERDGGEAVAFSCRPLLPRPGGPAQ